MSLQTSFETSRGTLPNLLLPVATPQFGEQGLRYPFARSLPVSNEPNVFVRKVEAPGDNCNHAPHAARWHEFGDDRCRIHVGNQPSGEGTGYLYADNLSTKKMREQITGKVRPAIGERIYRLRKSRGLSQVLLAQKLGLRHQSAIARWESGRDKPPAAVLLKIAELVPEAERQWWRDQAAEQTGLDSLRDVTAVTTEAERTIRIPLISKTERIGTLGSLAASDVDRYLYFPAGWFPEGGSIQAYRIDSNLFSPFAGDVTALVDVAKRDPDRLVGSVVAAKSAHGIRLCSLSKDGPHYMLSPLGLNAGPVKILQAHGENSIVGQVVRWFGDAPRPGK